MSTAQARIKAAGELSILANRQFTSENRELFSSFDHDALWRAMGSYIRLHEISAIAEAEPSVEAYVAIQRRSFLTLYDRKAVVPVADITSLGRQALDQMRRETGIGVENLPAPAAPAKTPQEILEDQIVNDWNTLSGDQFRAKCASDKRYRDTFKALSETNRIASGVVKKSSAPAERELAADQRLVKIDPDRYIRHIDGGQITCTNNRSEALIFSRQDAQILVSRLRKNRFPQCVVSE